jgi:hypothetical protein
VELCASAEDDGGSKRIHFGPARSQKLKVDIEKLQYGLAERGARVRSRSAEGRRWKIGLRTCKEQGEWAQLVFMARARQLGLTVLIPYGDSEAYDVGIALGGRLLRVQVKSTTFLRKGTFELNLVGPGREMYRPGDLDVFAIYIAPVDVWYIIPFEKLGGVRTLQLRPDTPGSRHWEFLEAWALLRG